MKQLIYFIIGLFVLNACTTDSSGKIVKKDKEQKTNEIDADKAVIDKLKLDNGLVVYWFERGNGAQLKDGDLVEIDYKVKLKDGTVVDGNHLLKRKTLPFLLGFNLQTKGWDIALRELRVGDYVKVLIPSKLARGDKGIEGLIPPNADNLLFIKIVSLIKPNRSVDGTNVWLLEENKDNKLKFNDKNRIIFHAMASTPSTPTFVNTFRSNQPFSFKLSDHGLVPGLTKALINAKKFDRMYIVVPSKEAYGKAGYLDIVRPDEPVFYNVLVMDVTKN